VRAAVTGAVRVSVEDIIVGVAGDVGGQAEVKVRCRAFKAVATA
jgi:hypothetical protein